ncbi:MAG: IS1595 family transposase [Prevotellaceae bacterium]|jgi:transposase|nr:IS1595 family transposase [Prevotellaceae bacterium]
MNNKYIFRSHISEKKFRDILRLFCVDVDATKTSAHTGVSRICVNRLFDKIRERIAEECEKISCFDTGEIELDESYFGAKRVRGKRGRGAYGKTPVFGMLKRNGNVYTQIVKYCSIKELLPIIESKADKNSTIYTDYFKTYDGLADFGYKRHYRIKHSDNEFANGRNHINGIENFWGLCKVRLSKYRGIHQHKFYLHLKECEFRYNNRNTDIYKYLLKVIKDNPIKLS